MKEERQGREDRGKEGMREGRVGVRRETGNEGGEHKKGGGRKEDGESGVTTGREGERLHIPGLIAALWSSWALKALSATSFFPPSQHPSFIHRSTIRHEHLSP